MTKITPQEFLDSTEYEFLTRDAIRGESKIANIHFHQPFNISVSLLNELNNWWESDSSSKELSRDEIDSIDWTGFDCSNPLGRTR